MTSTSQLAKLIEEIVNDGVIKLPFTKGGDIYVNHTMVQQSRRGYVVFDTKLKKKVCETFSKTAAVAVAKLNTHEQGNDNSINDVLRIDERIGKWYMDCLFYKNTINTTQNEIKREVTQNRYDIAYDKVCHLKEDLETYLYDK